MVRTGMRCGEGELHVMASGDKRLHNNDEGVMCGTADLWH